MRSDKIEITAPVGSFESLAAAVQAGADSVYFGIENLNMRSRSSINFTLKDLKKIVSLCSENNINCYLTLNTVIYDEDIAQMKSIIDAAKENKISAVIVSDQAAINYAFKKGVPVHLSTQMNISNFETVRFYSKYADAVVLARELSLDQISKISNQIEKEKITGRSGNLILLEVFIHGALCMSISGKCFMSLHMYNASANRGACYQLCRRAYKVTGEDGEEYLIDNNYIMSPKDLCTIGFLDKIIDSGVSILKIEGRGRSPEYVKTTTEVYKDAVRSINEGFYSSDKIDLYRKKLDAVFNRGFWDGHYFGDSIENWNTDVAGSKATEKKVYLAKARNYFKKIGIGEFQMETGSLFVGDTIYIIGPTTGVIKTYITELRVDDKPVNQVNKGDLFSTPIEKMVRPSDKLYGVDQSF